MTINYKPLTGGEHIQRGIKFYSELITPQQRIAAWVAALRSGKYKQGASQLHTHDDKFCCLGVACDISGLGTWDGMVYAVEEGETGQVAESAFTVLPVAVRDYFGLSHVNPPVGVGPNQVVASYANDVQQKSFEEIADLIEARYLGMDKAAV